MPTLQRRVRFLARGQVQGVGFRPFVFRLAREGGLGGFVRNSPLGVLIEVQGEEEAVAAFGLALEGGLPPLARLTGLSCETLDPVPGEGAFVIAESLAGSGHAVLVSPDIRTCDDCLREMREPGNRRCGYAFTNCTNCGPRYSITRAIPYDRPTTSMACFPLCEACREEYDNPQDRRFHAQPNACPDCGPKLWFVAVRAVAEDMPHWGFQRGSHRACAPRPPLAAGGNLPLHQLPQEFSQTSSDPLAAAASLLAGGGICAVKGLGGFHLACDAANDRAVARLRQRKHRPHKAFAVMAADLDAARAIALIGPEEETLLASPERPVVICPLRAPSCVSALVAPDISTVGIMLAYTPLHSLLLAAFAAVLREKGAFAAALRDKGERPRPAVLVMTSGNPGGEPICLGNREALDKLGGMADGFLLHDRDILVRVDDSVVRPLSGIGTLFFRRARGYVPRPLPAAPVLSAGPDSPDGPDAVVAPVVLGVGGQLKNTLCLTRGDDAFVGQHIGDMETLENALFHQEVREHLCALLHVAPQALVRDLHPDYASSAMAEELAREKRIPVLRLQHHFAHAHAVLAENGQGGPALALVLDGTGLGDDGSLWGGEFLFVDSSRRDDKGPLHKRLAHFAPLSLPGGEAAIREPWRVAHALLLRLGLVTAGDPLPPLPWSPEYEQAAALLPTMLERGINSPSSSSCGRLFDAVAALLGLCNAVTYEGQAAIRLEEAQGLAAGSPEDELYPCPFARNGAMPLQLDTHALFAEVYADLRRGAETPCIARRFHASLAGGLVRLAAHLARRHGVRHVGLSGGCLQNATLVRLLVAGLEQEGLTPLLHKNLPPGDGCISFGQAVWGRLLLERFAIETIYQ